MATQLAIPEAAEFQLPEESLSPRTLLAYALKNNAAIDVIERFAALQERADAKIAQQEYDKALLRVQAAVPRIIPDTTNTQSKKKHSSYEALDKIVRPIYLQNGFTLSFGTAECPYPDKVRTTCRVTHAGGHIQHYQIDITSDGSGPKGGGVLTRPHADLAANTLGMRRLLRLIFNIVDQSEDEMLTNGWLMERIDWIKNCRNPEELKRIFNDAFKQAKTEKAANAMLALVEARDNKQKEF